MRGVTSDQQLNSGGPAYPAVEQQRLPELCHLRYGKLWVFSHGHPACGGRAP